MKSTFFSQATLLLFTLCITSFLSCNAQHELPEDLPHIVFLGNSITYAGIYITDVEAYYITHNPQKKYEFINMGLPSETVSGLSEPGHAGGKFPRPDLHERLDRVLALTKPDIVYICYGMNDGIYLPLDSGRFQAFKDGLTDVHNRIAQTGATIVHLTPPYYDESKGHATGYEATVDAYADWVLAQQQNAGWNVVDVHYPMKQYTEEQRKKDTSFTLAADGVHPGELGHWIMAKQILLHMGYEAVADAADIHAALQPVPNGETVLKLVANRQSMMKDAWLTAAGHTRPGMKVGIPLNEAQEQYNTTEREINKLLKH